VSIAIAKTGEPPCKLKVLPWGDSFYRGGREKVALNERSLTEVPRMHKLYNYDRIALDFSHNSFPLSDAYKEPVTVAAFGELKVFSGDGAYLENLQWTPEGAKAWANGDYPDLSPVVKTEPDGTVTFFHSVALCRNGKLEGLHAFTDDISAIISPNSTNNKTMNPDEAKKIKGLLVAILGLSEDADLAAIETAAKDFGEKLKKAEGNKPPANPQPDALKAFSDSLGAIKTRLDKIEADGATARKSAIISAAIAAGKQVPADIAAKLDEAALQAFCANLPEGVVPLTKRSPDGLKEFTSNPIGSPVVASVCKTLGLSEEDFKKGSK